MKKLRFVSTFGVVVVLLLVVATSAYGGQAKVDVCHITGTYDFEDGLGEVPIGHVITIADPAYDSHIAHGDPEVHIFRTLLDGSEVCTAEVETPDTKTVFATSGRWPGNLGGLAGADAKCQDAADASPLVPEGTYLAWLSTDGEGNSPATGRFTESTVPYVRVDGVVVADGWADLTDGSLQATINVDENGDVLPTSSENDYYAWTGTDADGTYAGLGAECDCVDWTSIIDVDPVAFGAVRKVDFNWTAQNYRIDDCGHTFHLYCFQQ